MDGRSNNRLIDGSQLPESQTIGEVNDQPKANGPIVTGPDGDHVCIIMEEKSDEGKDKENQNGSEASVAHLMSTPYLRCEPSSMSALMLLETLDQPDDKYNIKKGDLKFTMNEDPGKSSVSVVNNNGTDNEAEEIHDMNNSPGSSDTHYEKLKMSDENHQYAELFPPNMQDILKELSDSAENILEFSRAEMDRSGPEDGYTGDDYDDDTSEYL